MRKEVANELMFSVDKLITAFNNPNREFYSGEEFKLKGVRVLSEYTAGVLLEKNTGKQALVGGFFIKDKWNLFFLRESHIYGMKKFEKMLDEIEQNNLKFSLEVNNDE
jgi:hypothetical protein